MWTMVSLIDLDRHLRTLIAGLAPGDALPRATDLKRRWAGSTYGQLRIALDRLEDEGLVKRRARKVWVAPRPGPPVRVSTEAELELRARIISQIRRVRLSLTTIQQRAAADMVIVAGTGDPELAHQRVRIAALTLHSPHADAIRSALGLDERTRDQQTLRGRREALSEHTDRTVSDRHERLGAQELAWHIESILDLEAAGVVDLDWGRQSPHDMLRTVLRRLESLESEVRSHR